ncbi:hypothetical protein DL98DRAFT_522942 [Cadophora sp. DSE1049]|nr:hypothetical protein DL98DRAFT_522942 [Cadophora sp. DSE1049]
MQPPSSNPGADVDKRPSTISISSNEPEGRPVPDSPSLGTPERRSESTYRSQHPPPARLNCFRASSIHLPIYDCSPWDFYKPFLALGGGRLLGLCNHDAITRVIRIEPWPISSFPRNTIFTILQVQHRNFVDYYEAYFFQGQVFTVSEYIDFSVKEMVNNTLYPTESEIAYIIGQVLAGMRFIESRGESATISRRTVRISREGKVKIDPTSVPMDGEGSSADASCLESLMLSMMNETQETLKATGIRSWSHEAIDFVKATSWATAEELFKHPFLSSPRGPETLVVLCAASSLLIKKDVKPLEAFSERFSV